MLRASTIIELIVAMLIVSSVFVMAMMVFSGVMNSSRTRMVTEAEIRILSLTGESFLSGKYLNEDIEYPNMVLHRVVSEYRNQKHLSLVTIEAVAKDGKVLLTKQFIRCTGARTKE